MLSVLLLQNDYSKVMYYSPYFHLSAKSFSLGGKMVSMLPDTTHTSLRITHNDVGRRIPFFELINERELG